MLGNIIAHAKEYVLQALVAKIDLGMGAETMNHISPKKNKKGVT